VPFRGDGDEHRERSWRWVQQWWSVNFPDWTLRSADSGHDPFNRGASRNVAARAATAPILIIADADTIPDPEAVCQGVDLVASERAPWVIPYEKLRYYNLSERATLRRLEFPPDPAITIGEPWDEDDWEHKITSWAGCLILRRVDYWRAGGYDERFAGWGGEDNAMQLALDTLVGPHHRMDSFIQHLSHARGDADFSHKGWPANAGLLAQYQRARGKSAAMMRLVTSRDRT